MHIMSLVQVLEVLGMGDCDQLTILWHFSYQIGRNVYLFQQSSY